MTCQISRKQLWSWVDRDAPELRQHLETCPRCRILAEQIREEIGLVIADTSALDVPMPEWVGPYKVRRLLGEGGQAFVYEAEQSSPKRPVALKVLKGGRFAGKRHIKHFRRETQTLAALQHPSIATIFEAGRTERGEHYFAMELVDGIPLDTYVCEHKLSHRDRLILFRKICIAVEYAHQHGVIHRDLKPSNILIDASGKPKILDFGLARITDPELISTMTVMETGLIEGTPRYMSPEQIRGNHREIDVRSDIYSLGIILYELLTGQPPYKTATTPPEMIQTICEEPPRLPSSIDRGLKGDPETILLRALEKEPARRYQTVKDLAEDIGRNVNGETILAKPLGRVSVLSKKLTRHKSRFVIAVFIIVLSPIGIWRMLQPPYDLEKARKSVLEIHCELLENGADKLLISRARAAPDRYPGLVDAVLVRAQGSYLNLDHHFALDVLTTELERDSTQWFYKLLLAEIQVGSGEAEGEMDAADFGMVESEQTAEDLYLHSLATLDLQRSLEFARECRRRDPDHLLAIEACARLSRISGDLDASLQAINELIERDHDSRYWLERKVLLFVKQERYEEAIRVLDEATARSPNPSYLYHRRGMIHRRMRRYEESVRDFTNMIRTVQREPYAAWTYYHRGTANWIVGKPEEAAADYEKATLFLGRATYANARRFLILREMNRPEDARRELTNARGNVRHDPWLARILAFLAGEVTNDQLVASAGDANPKLLCEAYYYIGESCRLAGRIEEARLWFRRCLDTGVSVDPDALIEPMSEYELAEWRLGQPLGVGEIEDR